MELIWQEILTHIVGFIILLLVLKRLAWKPLLALLDKRRQTIEQGLAQVEQARQEMERLKGEYGRHITAIEEEARKRLQAATTEGKQLALEIQEQARAQAQQILTKARDSLALEIAQAKLELRDHVVALTLGACGKLLRERLTEAKDRELILQFMQELERVEDKR